MIAPDLLRQQVYRAAGLVRARVPRKLCRFKRQSESGDSWLQDMWAMRAFRTKDQEWVPFSRGDFTGRFVFHFLVRQLPVEHLADTLRANGLTLKSSGAKTHPVLLLLGHQQGVRQILWPSGLEMNYLESIVGIPGVWLRDCSEGYCGPFNFATRIDANELSPVLLGLIVGYPKHVSWMDSSDGTFSINQAGTGARILTASFKDAGNRDRTRDQLLPNELAMLQDPVFSRSLVSPQIFTYIDWQFDEPWGWVQQATASVTVFRDLPGLPAGRYEWNEPSDGVVIRISVPWQLAGPFPRNIIGYNPKDPPSPKEAEIAGHRQR
jgi:hypothetical protein